MRARYTASIILALAMAPTACTSQVGLLTESGSEGEDTEAGTSSTTSTGPSTTTSGSPTSTTTSGPASATTPPSTSATSLPTTETASDSSGSTGFDPTNFISPGDAITGVGINCDIWLDNECPPGEKCMPWANDGGNSWNATRCSPVDSEPDQAGEPCTVEGSGTSGIDSCDYGAMCFGVDPETLAGNCVPFCIGSPEDPTCADANRSCQIGGSSLLALCTLTCNPLQQNCPEGDGCYDTAGEFRCVPDASGPMNGAYLDPCEFVNACDPGLLCTGDHWLPDCSDSTGCCTPFCDVADPVCPDASLWCIPYYQGGQVPGLGNLGFCGRQR